MNWFYSKDGKPAGPVNDEELERLAADGTVNATTLVWHNALSDWKPYAEVRPAGGTLHGGAPPPLFPPLPAPTASSDPVILPAGALAVPYAGFWIRVAASLFDSLILSPVMFAVFLGFFIEFPDLLSQNYSAGVHARTFFQIAVLVIVALYEMLAVGRFAATPGKMVCDLRIVRGDGSPVSYTRALCRHFCKRISGAIFFLGYVMVAFDTQKRGLHDYICDTRVIRE